MEHPELIQATRTKRKKVNIIQVIVSVILAIVITMLAAGSSKAETLAELNRKETAVGIAPGSVESEAPAQMELPGAAYLPFHENISRIFYKEWTDAGLELADMFVILDIESDGSGDGVILDKGHAVSGTHDYGWFQINWTSWKGAAKRICGVTSADQLMDPYVNVRMAIYVYGDCVAKYGRGSRAWSCYNTGKGYNSTKYSRKAEKALQIWEERLKKG